MCGIAGWYSRGRSGVTRAVISAQCNTIIHRGPDDWGVLVDGDFGFGMRRLSIIDVEGGHQPMETADGRFSIIFNGEIYNHLKLREELLRRGHAFRTRSDTETILVAYQEWGEETWHRLDGMFAVAIWDRRERSLTLARDHVGIKPLYYTMQNGGLAFGSELKALMPLPGHRFDVDPRAVHDLFTFGHIRTDRSIYAQVRTLTPGHSLTIRAGGDAQIREFWRPVYVHASPRGEKEWIEGFREKWMETVRSHLLADVEVGAFLSGGIDSSAIVAMMSRITGEPIKTFTIGFPIERYNEAPFAEAVARHLGCDHTTRVIDLGRARDLLPQLQRGYDEPFADPSAVPTWYLSQLAREHVKVVLSGDGGDELFMGYKRHLTARTIGSIPQWLRQPFETTVCSLPSTPFRAWNRKVQRWQKTAAAAHLPDGASRFFAQTQITSTALRKRVFSEDMIRDFEPADLAERLRDEYFPDPGNSISPNELEQFAYADLTLNLPCAMLTKVDRASMAHSLEVRVPFLSPSLVDWAMGVPAGMKIRGKTGKYLLRRAIEPWMPEGIVDRRKQGFQIPLAEWFDGDFGSFAHELWRDSGAGELGLLRPGEVGAVFDEHSTGKRDHGRFLYALAQFSLWWADRKQTPVAPPAEIVGTIKPAVTHVPVAANDAGGRIPARAIGIGRAASIVALFGAGWLMHDVAGPVVSPARASTFVDDAVMAYRSDLVSDAFESQAETAKYDRTRIAKASGIRMPVLPATWKVLDVQIIPSGGTRSVNLAVRLPDGVQFSIFGMKSVTAGGGRPIADKRDGDNVVYWEEGQSTFAVVGAIPSKRLLRLVVQLDPDGPAISP
jgi:asparagine synthase (glutamine-hydrolysing)